MSIFVVDESMLPDVRVARETVLERCRAVENSARKLAEHAKFIEDRWATLNSAYVTSHTRLVLAKMAGIQASASRGSWVYPNVASAVADYVEELTACEVRISRLRRSIRTLRASTHFNVSVLVPGSPEYRQNLALLRNIADVRRGLRFADERCVARLNAVGEPGTVNDPYEGLAYVTDDGSVITAVLKDQVRVSEITLDWELFGKAGRPRGSHVDQGSLGDCFFLSSLASLADKDPDAIERMVHDNGDGTYTVTLYMDGTWHAVQVDGSVLSSNGSTPRFAGNSPNNNDHALWPLLVEKAAIKLYGGDYLALNAGTGSMTMELFTGIPARDDFNLPHDPWEPEDIAKYSALTKDPTVLMTANSDVGYPATVELTAKVAGKNVPDFELDLNHVYQVESIDAEGNVTLVNPHNDHSSDDGPDKDVFQLTPEQFSQYFACLSVGGTR